MVDYPKMSDFEINCEVAKANNWTSKSFTHEIHSGKWNPCQNAGDAWHIIAESKITILACDDLWIACPAGSVIDGDTSESQSSMYVNSWSKCPFMADINPLRAAMIVFLMMQDAKNG